MRTLTRRWPALLAAALLLAGCGTDTGTDAGGIDPGGSGPLPSEWRTEYWHDASVEVPAGWAYGGAPMRQGGENLACYASAMVTAAGGDVRGDERAVPYVGRPLMLTDVCQVYPFIGPDEDPPAAPSVWLGSPLEPGTDDLGDGWVRETVAVGSTTVTVTSDDPGLRERVLGSVGGPGRCAPRLDAPTHPESMLVEGYGEPVSLDLCVYRAAYEGDPLELAYAAELGQAPARAFGAAIAQAPAARPDCGGRPPYEWVTVQLTGEPGPDSPVGVGGTQEMAIGCGVVEVAPGETVALDEQVLDALRVDGLPATTAAVIGRLG